MGGKINDNDCSNIARPVHLGTDPNDAVRQAVRLDDSNCATWRDEHSQHQRHPRARAISMAALRFQDRSC